MSEIRTFYRVDLKNLQKKLKELGYTSFTPTNVGYRYYVNRGFLLVVNAAMEVYPKSMEGIRSEGINRVDIQKDVYGGETTTYNEEILLVVVGNGHPHEYMQVSNIVESEKLVPVDNIKTV